MTSTTAPRLQRVMLRAGTRFFLIVEGRLSEALVLDNAIEVNIGDLGQRPGEFNTYEAEDGTTILVRIEDEILR